MTVILRTLMAGPGGTYPPGTRVAFDPETEEALVRGGYATAVPAERAEPVAEADKQTATKPPREKRAK